MTTSTISRQCAGLMHSACDSPDTCGCAICHQGDCARCDATNCQVLYNGICASCYRRQSDRSAGAWTPCDTAAEHGRGVRNPGTRRNEYLCLSCHADSGAPLVFRGRDISLYVACAGQDILSELHEWQHIRGNKFACMCGTVKYDSKAAR